MQCKRRSWQPKQMQAAWMNVQRVDDLDVLTQVDGFLFWLEKNDDLAALGTQRTNAKALSAVLGDTVQRSGQVRMLFADLFRHVPVTVVVHLRSAHLFEQGVVLWRSRGDNVVTRSTCQLNSPLADRCRAGPDQYLRRLRRELRQGSSACRRQFEPKPLEEGLIDDRAKDGWMSVDPFCDAGRKAV